MPTCPHYHGMYNLIIEITIIQISLSSVLLPGSGDPKQRQEQNLLCSLFAQSGGSSQGTQLYVNLLFLGDKVYHTGT